MVRIYQKKKPNPSGQQLSHILSARQKEYPSNGILSLETFYTKLMPLLCKYFHIISHVDFLRVSMM